MEHKRKFMITKALKFASYGTFEHFGFFLFLMLLAFLERALMVGTLSLALGLKLLKGFTDYQFSTAQLFSTLFSKLSMKVFLVILGVYSLFMITSGIVSALLIKAGLEIYETGNVAFRNLLVDWRRIMHLVLGMFIYGALCFLGFMFFIIPGIILSVIYGYYRFFIIDKNMKPLEALKASAFITRGARLEVLSLLVILNLLNALGAFLWGLGLFITVPLSLLAQVYAYRRLSLSSMERS